MSHEPPPNTGKTASTPVNSLLNRLPRELLDEVRRYYEEGRGRFFRPPLESLSPAERFEYECSPNRVRSLLTNTYPHWGQLRGTLPLIDPEDRNWLLSRPRYVDTVYDAKRCTYWLQRIF